jgi:hypothetical protein
LRQESKMRHQDRLTSLPITFIVRYYAKSFVFNAISQLLKLRNRNQTNYNSFTRTGLCPESHRTDAAKVKVEFKIAFSPLKLN